MGTLRIDGCWIQIDMDARINPLFTCLCCPLNMDVKVGLSQSPEDEDESDSKRKKGR